MRRFEAFRDHQSEDTQGRRQCVAICQSVKVLQGETLKRPDASGGRDFYLQDALPSVLHYAIIAQQAEQLICNQQVGGSSPSGGSNSFLKRGGEQWQMKSISFPSGNEQRANNEKLQNQAELPQVLLAGESGV